MGRQWSQPGGVFRFASRARFALVTLHVQKQSVLRRQMVNLIMVMTNDSNTLTCFVGHLYSGKEFLIKFIPRSNNVSSSAFTFLKSFSKSKSMNNSAANSDAEDTNKDGDSDCGSVTSERHYGTKIQQLTLQADTPEVCHSCFSLVVICCQSIFISFFSDVPTIVATVLGNDDQ
jgi:hypothetical protein